MPFLNWPEANRNDVGSEPGADLGAVAIDADTVVDGLAAREVLGAEVDDHSGVIDDLLVVGNLQARDLRRVGGQGPRTLGAAVGDLAKVADQIEELLPCGQPVQ